MVLNLRLNSNNMNILVTGGNGQLGNEMRRLALNSENSYVFTDVTTPDGVDTVVLDITDIKEVRKIVADGKISCIINCAAFTNVDKAEDDYDMAYRLNATAVSNLAIVAKEADVLLFHLSTDYVFQGDACIPYSEDYMTNPLGAYGKTKLAGETAVMDSGCKFIIFRTSWLYSPYGNNFVKTMRRLTTQQPVVKVVFDQVGTPTYAGDLAAAIFDIVENDKYEGNQGIYHFSDEGVCSWFDFAIEIARLSGIAGCSILPCHSNEFPSKVRRPSFSVLDKTKYKKTFGRNVPYWRDSLKKCIAVIDSGIV